MQTEINVSLINAFITPVFTGIVEGMNKDNDIENQLRKRIIEDPLDAFATQQTSADFFIDSLCEAITTLVQEIMVQSYRYASYDIEITSMWGNIQRHGNYCFKHTHANSVFSGVFYVNEYVNFPPIQFHRTTESSFDLKVNEENELNRGKIFLYPKKDMIVIFPSWLEHDVPVNTSGQDRLSISFNIMCRGKFGQENSRQEVNI